MSTNQWSFRPKKEAVDKKALSRLPTSKVASLHEFEEVKIVEDEEETQQVPTQSKWHLDLTNNPIDVSSLDATPQNKRKSVLLPP